MVVVMTMVAVVVEAVVATWSSPIPQTQDVTTAIALEVTAVTQGRMETEGAARAPIIWLSLIHI